MSCEHRPVPRFSRRQLPARLFVALTGNRHRKAESTALSRFALDEELAAMKCDKVADDGQAQAVSGLPADQVMVGAKELFAQPADFLGRQADARVTDTDQQVIHGYHASIGPAKRHPDRTAVRCVHGCVSYHMGEDLNQALPIGQNRRQIPGRFHLEREVP